MSESLQDAPVAVTAFTEGAIRLRNYVSVADLASTTPNLTFQLAGRTGAQSAALYIRGVGQVDSSPLSDPAVGVYVDGVYLPRNVGNIVRLGDIERVEVLRGPQGTLFGKNTIGGALNITLNKPGPAFQAEAEATLGTLNQYGARLMVNVPLSDKLFLRVSGVGNTQNGYITLLNYPGKELGDDHTVIGRAQLRWLATPKLTIDLGVDGVVTHDSGTPEILTAVYPQGLIPTLYNRSFSGSPDCLTTGGQATNPVCYGPVSLPANRKVSRVQVYDRTGQKVDPRSWDEQLGTNLVANWDLGAVNLKSITSYRHQRNESRENLGQTEALFFEGNKNPDISKQFAEELQLSGKIAENLKWLLGAYYSKENFTSINEALGPIALTLPIAVYPVYSITDFDGATRNYAGFGQVTYDPTSWVHVTGGIRYTDERKTADALVRPSTLPPLSGVQQARRWTPLVSLGVDLSPTVRSYVSYSEGFRSGGFPARLTGQLAALPNFGPETIKSFELGLKSELFDRRLRANIAAFTSKYTDIQQSGTSNAIIPPVPTVINAGDARFKGVEAELTGVVTDELTVDGSAAYLHSELTSINPTANDGGVPITLDKKLVYAPKWKLSLGATYDYQLSGGGSIVARVDTNYTSRVWFSIGNQDRQTQGAVFLVNLNLTYKLPDNHTEVAFGVRNLTNRWYYTFGVQSAPVNGNAINTVAPPRTAFATVRWRY